MKSLHNISSKCRWRSRNSISKCPNVSQGQSKELRFSGTKRTLCGSLSG